MTRMYLMHDETFPPPKEEQVDLRTTEQLTTLDDLIDEPEEPAWGSDPMLIAMHREENEL